MMTGRRNRVEALIGIGLLGVSGLLVLAFLSIYRNGQQVASAAPAVVVMTSVPPTSTPETIALWEAYEQARVTAQAQAQDAQLVSASTQWQAAREEALLAGSESWGFAFYSPASGHMLDVVVSADKAWVVNQSPTWNAPIVLSEGKWRAGPRDVLLTFLAHGGREFLDEHPQAMVELHLAEHEDGYPAWNAVALDSTAKDSFAVLIDAETMQVLSSVP